MRVFYFENNKNQKVPPSGGTSRLMVGALRLPAGSYAIAAKLNAGVNAGGGYPGPPWPHGGGAATLAFADASDEAFVSIKPESGANNENVSLIIAGTSARDRRARLYFINPYPLPVYIHLVRILALQVDEIVPAIEGEDTTTVPEDEEEELRNAIQIASLRTRDLIRLIEDD